MACEQYSRVWYQLDQLYRQFIYHVRTSGQTTLLAPLAEQVENLYTNNYLLKLNDRWQQLGGCGAKLGGAAPVLQPGRVSSSAGCGRSCARTTRSA